MSDLRDWRPVAFAPPAALRGRHARLERLSLDDHAEPLHAANLADPTMWRHLPYGPFVSFAAYRGWAAAAAVSEDPVFYAIRGHNGWTGVASWLRIDRPNGVIEIGHVALSAALQRSVAATEAIHLLIDHALASGFRRVEWKCNAANTASRRAAERLGFTYEGTFRQHMVVKGSNRDTAWYAILDGEWPTLRRIHRDWLSPETFDGDGRQLRSLSAATASRRPTRH